MILPLRMRTLQKDSRGYPIPYIVFRDKTGQPQFTINDSFKVERCWRKKLCAICGKKLQDGFWFVGGSRAFLHPRGAFVDPPNHLECAQYALVTCPFLAAPNYTRRIDTAKLKPENKPDNIAIARIEGMSPRLPESFGLGRADSYYMQRGLYIVSQWDYLEFWHAGQPCNAPADPQGPPAQENLHD